MPRKPPLPAPTPAEALAAKKTHKLPKWGTRRAARRSVTHPLVALRSLREDLHLTQRDVSTGAGINNATVADAEAGFEVALSTALKLAKFFGKTVDEIWAQ